MKTNVTIIIVTYNRLDELKKTLKLYDEQSLSPNRLIVIDNACNDGTADYLDSWCTESKTFERIVYHSEKNVGGAGGFKIGIEQAMQYNDDFIFLADDDAYPDKDMLENLLEYYEHCDEKETIAALCTKVNDQFGVSKVHRARVKKGLLTIRRDETRDDDYLSDHFDVDLLTFVGAMIKRKTIERIGLPLSEYFIHEDDAEYSTRIRKIGRIVCVTSSNMFHLYGGNQTKDWIEYYTTRNYIDYIGRHYQKRYQLYVEMEKYIKKCSIIAKVFKKRSKNYRKMNRIAISDGKKGKLGISELYKPGQIIG